MPDRHLRFSERKALAESGSLGDLRNDVPDQLRNAIALYLHYARARVPRDVQVAFDGSLGDQLGRHFGDADLNTGLLRPLPDEFLDVVEILVQEGERQRIHTTFRRGAMQRSAVSFAPTIEADFNALFDRHRFGYRVEDGAALPISSPLLDVELVGPALLAVAKPGWEQAERSYKEALSHQRRADEHRLALTAATAAVEAALKAAGYSGATLGDLARSFRQSPVASGYSPRVVEYLVELLEQLMAWRSHSGSAHGGAPGAEDPPPELAALAIHWAGAFISYLGSIPRVDATQTG